MVDSQQPWAVAWSHRPDPDRVRRERAALASAARRSGVIQGAVGLAAAALARWAFHRSTLGLVIASVAALVTLLALTSPLGAFRRVTGWVEKLGRAIGAVVTWLLMPLVYYLLFLPLGLFLRARHRLRIAPGPDRRLPTYWITTRTETAGPPTADSYRKQF